jgi:serine/threonine protein kinase
MFLEQMMICTNLPEDYELLDRIGEGAFGLVHRAIEIDTDDYYAIKTIQKSHLERKEVRDMMFNEIDICRHIDHDNVINLHRLYEDETSVHLVLDLVKGQTLT